MATVATEDAPATGVEATGTAPEVVEAACVAGREAVALAVLVSDTVGVAETCGFGAVTSWAIAASSGVMTDGMRWRRLRTGAAGAGWVVASGWVDGLLVAGIGLHGVGGC